jgi:hypothetical protein
MKICCFKADFKQLGLHYTFEPLRVMSAIESRDLATAIGSIGSHSCFKNPAFTFKVSNGNTSVAESAWSEKRFSDHAF